MVEALGPAPAHFLDLGTGAGIPGLVLALAWPASTGALLDSRQRRTAFLTDAIAELNLSDRLEIVTARAEDAARDPRHRAAFDLVVARGFGRPAVTAECAVGFLKKGGRLAVSEPPDTTPTTRWPEAAAAQLGLTPPRILQATGATVALLTLTTPPKDKWPRRPGIPRKRPLW